MIKPFDFVITVCDRAKEACVIWPDARQQDHWSIDDPASARTDEERMRVFRRVREERTRRMGLFLLARKVV